MSLFSLPIDALSSVLTNIMDTAFEDYSVHKSVTRTFELNLRDSFPEHSRYATQHARKLERLLCSLSHIQPSAHWHLLPSLSLCTDILSHIILDPAPEATFIRNFLSPCMNGIKANETKYLLSQAVFVLP